MKQSLNALIKSHFERKISSAQCKQCRHVSKDSGAEQLKIIDFPRYLIIFLNPFDKSGGLSIPLKHFGAQLDLTEYKEETMKTLGKKYIYDLTAIMSHEQTTGKAESMYTAVVKKRTDDQKEKQWLTFEKDKMTKITQREALSEYPAQILFYSLVGNK